MAIVHISRDFLADMLFGWSENPVQINDGEYDLARNEFVFEIEGKDVPDVAEVQARVTLEANRAGERFHRLRFEER